MRLHIVRHAKSSWKVRKRDDRARPLNKRGRRDAPLMARHLAAAGVRPQCVLLSDSTRTRETADLLCAGQALEPATLHEDSRLYLADTETLLTVLAETPVRHTDVMLIGHNPGVTALVAMLTGAALEQELPTMAVATLDLPGVQSWRDLHPGCAAMLSCVAPKALREHAPAEGSPEGTPEGTP